jgi:hypothetical protein
VLKLAMEQRVALFHLRQTARNLHASRTPAVATKSRTIWLKISGGRPGNPMLTFWLRSDDSGYSPLRFSNPELACKRQLSGNIVLMVVKDHITCRRSLQKPKIRLAGTLAIRLFYNRTSLLTKPPLQVIIHPRILTAARAVIG